FVALTDGLVGAELVRDGFEADHQSVAIDVAPIEVDALLLQKEPQLFFGVDRDGRVVLPRDLQRRIVAKDVWQRAQQGDQQDCGDEDVFPASVFEHVQALFSVPLGISEATWNFWTLTRTPSAISSVMNVSPTSVTRPRMPPVVTTSSPVESLETRLWC